MLISRPAGREAWLAARAYALPQDSEETIEVDFQGVDVMAPSWADEFLTPLVAKHGKERIVFTTFHNPSVRATLEMLNLI